MNKKFILFSILGVFLLGIITAVILGGIYVSYSNKEVRLRNTIKAKLVDNTSEYDNMWKKIKQVAQVTEKERESLMEIFTKHAEARTSGGSKDGSLMKWVTESVPKVDNTAYKNLMNIITSSRDAWTMRQKELIDLKREHDNTIMTFPGSIFLSSRGVIEIKVITSKKTKKVFETGEDDDADVFGK
jgi:hypothetical protein